MSNRALHIETIRGIACLALVSMHTVGYTPQSGLELPRTDWLFRLQVMFADMRMPLFSFISGFVFVAMPRGDQSWGGLVSKKMRRLLIPMMSVGTLFWAVRAVMGYDQPDLFRIYVFPFEHFWFLQATFLLMLVLLALNALMTEIWPSVGDKGQAAVVIGLCGAVAYVIGLGNNWVFFSARHALFLAPFFMAGHVLATSSVQGYRLSGKARGYVLICFLVLVGFSALMACEVITVSGASRRLLSLSIGLLTCLFLMALRPQNRLLAQIGGASYAIYLFHVFFTAAVTEFLRYILPGLDRHWIYVPALVAGIVGPTLAQSIILRSSWASWLFLGLRFPRRESVMVG